MRNLRLALAGLMSASALTVVSSGVGVAAIAATPSLATCKTAITTEEFTKGKLTVATDNPVYTPWFVNNKPSNGKGYESAVAYAIAQRARASPRATSSGSTSRSTRATRPGPSRFDFDINEVSYTAPRAQGRHLLQQLLRRPAVDRRAQDQHHREEPHARRSSRRTSTATRSARPGLAYINNYIKPTKPRAGLLDPGPTRSLALWRRTRSTPSSSTRPTGQYMASAQIVEQVEEQAIATQVGQFPSVGEHYGLLFQKGNPLVGCVNAAHRGAEGQRHAGGAADASGSSIYTSVPIIKP